MSAKPHLDSPLSATPDLKPFYFKLDPEAGKVHAFERERFLQSFELTVHYQQRGAMARMVRRLLEAGRFAWAGFNEQNTEVLSEYERPPSDAVHR